MQKVNIDVWVPKFSFGEEEENIESRSYNEERYLEKKNALKYPYQNILFDRKTYF